MVGCDGVVWWGGLERQCIPGIKARTDRQQKADASEGCQWRTRGHVCAYVFNGKPPRHAVAYMTDCHGDEFSL